MDINFDVQETRPGKEVVVSVKADPDSTVHLLAVDKSVLILRNDNDIKESRVTHRIFFLNLFKKTSSTREEKNKKSYQKNPIIYFA